MNSNTRVYYQDVDMKTVLESYAKGFKPPGDGTLLKWDANYDPHTGRVWFRLTVEMAANDNHKIVVPDKIIALPG